MTLDSGEFIRRLLLHVLPDGFHRIRHYGFLANGVRVAAIARVRAALEAVPPEQPAPETDAKWRRPQATRPRRTSRATGTGASA